MFTNHLVEGSGPGVANPNALVLLNYLEIGMGVA
jgi:hypothetical protein